MDWSSDTVSCAAPFQSLFTLDKHYFFSKDKCSLVSKKAIEYAHTHSH